MTLVERVKRFNGHPYWSYMPAGRELMLEDVTKGTFEYISVLSGIRNSLSENVVRITRIQNPYLWGCYLLKKEEYKSRCIAFEELTLYHETNSSYVNSIATNNFDWRLSGRRAKYGEGVSFSYRASYAHGNSSNHGVLLVVRVLVGNTQSGSWHMVLPTSGCDTTTSGGNHCNVYVKYSDHEFYPEYAVYYF